jgi:Tetratrico peptide repeat
VLADCERALGRPEKAVDIYRTADRAALGPAEAIELLIVAAGARRDLGQTEAAVAMLQVRELGVDAPYAARLRYAYADGLLTVGRREEAREWFSRAVDADEDGATDAAERLLELDGIVLEGDEDVEEEETAPAEESADAAASGDVDSDEHSDEDLDYDDASDEDAEDEFDDEDADDEEDFEDEDLDEAADGPELAAAGGPGAGVDSFEDEELDKDESDEDFDDEDDLDDEAAIERAEDSTGEGRAAKGSAPDERG